MSTAARRTGREIHLHSALPAKFIPVSIRAAAVMEDQTVTAGGRSGQWDLARLARLPRHRRGRGRGFGRGAGQPRGALAAVSTNGRRSAMDRRPPGEAAAASYPSCVNRLMLPWKTNSDSSHRASRV